VAAPERGDRIALARRAQGHAPPGPSAVGGREDRASLREPAVRGIREAEALRERRARHGRPGPAAVGRPQEDPVTLEGEALRGAAAARTARLTPSRPPRRAAGPST